MVALKWKVHCDFDDKKNWQICRVLRDRFFAVLAESTVIK